MKFVQTITSFLVQNFGIAVLEYPVAQELLKFVSNYLETNTVSVGLHLHHFPVILVLSGVGLEIGLVVDFAVDNARRNIQHTFCKVFFSETAMSELKSKRLEAT